MSNPPPPRFPAFLEKETNIWNAYLTQHPGQFQTLDYNVRVGKGFDPGPSFTDSARRDAIMNSQLRIDVVGYDGAAWWLVEVKVRAGAGAVGQLLQYKRLFQDAYPEKKPLKLMMVTDRPKLGLDLMCAEYDVGLQVPA
jgi:hypothetical protein